MKSPSSVSTPSPHRGSSPAATRSTLVACHPSGSSLGRTTASPASSASSTLSCQSTADAAVVDVVAEERAPADEGQHEEDRHDQGADHPVEGAVVPARLLTHGAILPAATPPVTPGWRCTHHAAAAVTPTRRYGSTGARHASAGADASRPDRPQVRHTRHRDHLPNCGGRGDPRRQRRHRTPLGGRRAAALAAPRGPHHRGRAATWPSSPSTWPSRRGRRARPHPRQHRQRPQPDERHRHPGQGDR